MTILHWMWWVFTYSWPPIGCGIWFWYEQYRHEFSKRANLAFDVTMVVLVFWLVTLCVWLIRCESVGC